MRYDLARCELTVFVAYVASLQRTKHTDGYYVQAPYMSSQITLLRKPVMTTVLNRQLSTEIYC